jgi:4-hydroxyphenylacetate decarboxylase large subunit
MAQLHPMKLTEVLAERGLSLESQANGEAPKEIQDREVKKEPTPRANYLRNIYFDTLSSLDVQESYWYTRAATEHEGEVPIMRRAYGLKSVFQHLDTPIWPHELLVGAKAGFYRGSAPLPWLTESFFMDKDSDLYKAALATGAESSAEVSHFGAGGGNVTKSFGNVVSVGGKYGVRREIVPAMHRLAYAWAGKSVEDVGRKYEQMVPEYKIKENIMKSVVSNFDSGFTIPQGREVMNYYYVLEYGFDGLIDFCEKRAGEVAGEAGGDGISGMDRLYYYKAMAELCRGLSAWFDNYGREADRLLACTEDETSRAELSEISERMHRISHEKPMTFKDALQAIYLLHLAELNEDAMSGLSPGRIGQVLYPYFEQDIEAGRLTEAEAEEWNELYRVKMTCIDAFACTGVVGGVLSGNTFNNVCIGGLDREGKSAANRLEMLILEAGIKCQTTQPTLSLLYDEATPEEFLLKCMECIKTGAGYPAVMNNRIGMEFIQNQYQHEGMTVRESRAWSVGGRLETSPGTWMPLHHGGKLYWIPGGSGQPTSVGVHFLNNPKILELTLNNGFDKRTGLQVFEPHNRSFDTFDDLVDQYKKYYEKSVEVLNKCMNNQHDVWRKFTPSIINSLLKPNCLERGLGIAQKGYRYNATFNIECCGMCNQINSFAAIKKLVYDGHKYTLDQLKDAFDHNFGYKTSKEVGSESLKDQEKRDDDDGRYDEIHADCLRAPKYGNDKPYVDDMLYDWEQWFCEDMPHKFESLYAEPLYVCQMSVSTHGPEGAVTGATADGRLEGTTFADASMSAYPGTDTHGQYALFESATGWDHSMSQNSQMNLKIHPSATKGVEGSRKLLDLTRAYMRKGGLHIQYNIVDSRVLKKAQAHPENYRTLLIRVAGFTQYWVEIGKPIQDEVIARTEYESI